RVRSPKDTSTPTLLREARGTTSSAGKARSARMPSISRPTLPVAPTTATLKPMLVLQPFVKPVQTGFPLTRPVGRKVGVKENPPCTERVRCTARWRGSPLLLGGNARRFNDGEAGSAPWRHAAVWA